VHHYGVRGGQQDKVDTARHRTPRPIAAALRELAAALARQAAAEDHAAAVAAAEADDSLLIARTPPEPEVAS
jgi:hypothetical protein